MRLSVLLLAVIASSVLLANLTHATPPSPYSGQESRKIKALSTEDVQAYLAGKGMGFAKAAELNGYPGPSHVLTLAADLGLTADQKQRTESLFSNMESTAIALGRPLIEGERKLDQMFAEKTVTPESLGQALARIGELQAQIRQAHLAAHLVQAEILTPAQLSKYMILRGYTDTLRSEDHAGHKH